MVMEGRLAAKTESTVLSTFRHWIPILMFHEVVADSTHPLPPYAVTRFRFREILTDFASRGYTSGTLDDAVFGLGEGARVRGKFSPASTQGRRLVLTFDDGTHDFLDNALPVLQELDFSATLFIVTSMIGKKRLWDALPGQPALSPVPLMGVQELRDARNMGFTIGSHTVSHRPLPSLVDKEAREEIALSRQVLSNLLGESVRWFAYPYLAASQVTQDLVHEAGYEGACGGMNQKPSRFYLSRIDASYYTARQLRLRCNGLFNMARLGVRQTRHALSRSTSV